MRDDTWVQNCGNPGCQCDGVVGRITEDDMFYNSLREDHPVWPELLPGESFICYWKRARRAHKFYDAVEPVLGHDAAYRSAMSVL